MLISARNARVLNTFITPDLYRDMKKSFVRDLSEIVFHKVPFTLLGEIRDQLNYQYLNLNAYMNLNAIKR